MTIIKINEEYITIIGLEKNELIALMNTNKAKRRQMIEDMIAEQTAVINASKSKLSAYEAEIVAIEELAKAKRLLMLLETGQLTSDNQSADQQAIENARRRVEEIENARKNIQALQGMVKLFDEVDKKSESKSKSSKEEYRAEADRYARINQELDKNNVLLAKNKTLQDLAKEGSEEQLKLIEEENSLYKERQDLLHQLNQQRRQEVLELQKDLSKEGFKFIGSGDSLRIDNLDHIQGKTKEVEDMFKRFNELQHNLIPQTSQQWWDYQVTIVKNIEKIEVAIQSHIDQLKALETELANFDLSGKIADLNKQLDAAKFNHWIESLVLGLERYNDKTELLTFKLSLFDEEDYENRANVIADLFSASQEKLKSYREEWDKLSKQTPKNANEANQIANAMKQVQQGMRDAFVATREYQRQLEKIQFDAISKDIEKANKQLELQLSIIDHNLKSLQDGVLPDFSLDLVMPIPDFSDIFDETKSENERVYNEQVDFEKQIQELKKQSLAMQLADAEEFYATEMNKLIDHYNELIAKIAEKEAEIAELRDFLNEEQQKQLTKIQETINKIIEENNQAKLEAEEEHGKVIEDTKLEHYMQLLNDLENQWIIPEEDAITTHQMAVEYITSDHLGNLQSSYSNAWGNIVKTVSSSVAQIQSLVSQANSAIASMGSVSQGGGSSHPTVSAYAKGTSGHQGGLALIGEEGREIGILPSGKVVLLGKNGSQLVDLPKGTHVIPHDETEEILKHTGNIDGKQIPKYKDGTIPRYADG